MAKKAKKGTPEATPTPAPKAKPEPAAPAPKGKPEAAPPGPLASAKKAVAKAAGKVAGAVTQAAEAAQKHVVAPVAEAVGLAPKPKVKTKRTRFVRPKVEKKSAPPPAPAIPAGKPKTATGKLLTKNLKAAPKDEPKGGPGPRL